MSRSVTDIESDLARGRADWQGAIEDARLAAIAAADLRSRAVAGDATVSAKQLGEADDLAAFSVLPIEGKETAVIALEAELVVAKTEAWADSFTAIEPPLRAAVVATFAAIESSLDALVVAWRAHADVVRDAARVVDVAVSSKASPRVRRDLRGIVVDGELLRVVACHDRLATLLQKTHDRLFANGAQA